MTWFRLPVYFDHRDSWPPVDVIYAHRRRALLKARRIRNALIEQRLTNPRIRKPITKEIVGEPKSRCARAEARFYKRAIEEIT